MYNKIHFSIRIKGEQLSNYNYTVVYYPHNVHVIDIRTTPLLSKLGKKLETVSLAMFTYRDSHCSVLDSEDYRQTGRVKQLV